MSEQPDRVALRVEQLTKPQGKRGDIMVRGSGITGIVADRFNTAPWLSREEQEMILKGLRANCNCIELGEMAHHPACSLRRARDLLQSRLYPTTGDRG